MSEKVQVHLGSAVIGFAIIVVVVGEVSPGEAIYNKACVACHASGVAGAPKLGDKAAWEPRLALGVDGLLQSAITGKNAMPPRGTCMDCSDDDLKIAIEFMLGTVGAAPAAEATSAPAAETAPAPAPQLGPPPRVVRRGRAGRGWCRPRLRMERLPSVTHSTTSLVAGAPKLGDKPAWAPRVAQGMDSMLATAVNGRGAMPPRGTCMDCSDEDLQAAIAYMVSQAQ